MMPYFTTVKGDFAQLCVNTAMEKPCTEPNCKYSYVPKAERPCQAFHTPKTKCPFDTRCLLGHAEAREAIRQSKAFAKHKEWQAQVKNAPGTYGETDPAESGTAKGIQPSPTNPMETNQPAPKTDSAKGPNPEPAVVNEPNSAAKPAAAIDKVSEPQPNPPGEQAPVNFQTMAQENAKRGREDEMHRLSLLTQALQTDVEKLKKTQKEKEVETRTLQTAMGTLQTENHALQDENESKLPLLDAYYQRVFEKSSKARSFLDLNASAPSDKALEGLLVIIASMYSRPRELDGDHILLDLFDKRPTTRFPQTWRLCNH